VDWKPCAVDGASAAGGIRGMIHLVTGGARSGKSTFALQEVLRHAPAGPIGFIATAQALDDDMQQRIRAHQAERDARFLTFEAPIDLSGALAAPAPAAFVVDCLTLWCSNVFFENLQNSGGALPDAAAFDEKIATLIDQLSACSRPVITVTNEVGLGIVPGDALSRSYRDWLGRINQRVAARAERVTLLVAGIPMQIKPSPYASGA
jgi:adenosylcobinamide kinase/adenosylcobinamide-phosphate guanylyltransferase